MHLGKIVRSKIPNIVKEETASLPEIEYINVNHDRKSAISYFLKKIEEEANELINAKSNEDIIEEAADLLQVVKDYLYIKSISLDDVNTKQILKAVSKGGFLKKLDHEDMVLTVWKNYGNT